MRFGAVVENVIFDAETREIDYNDVSITENTRCAYPLQARRSTPGVVSLARCELARGYAYSSTYAVAHSLR